MTTALDRLAVAEQTLQRELDIGLGDLNQMNRDVAYDPITGDNVGRYLVVEENHHMGGRGQFIATTSHTIEEAEEQVSYLLCGQEYPDWQPRLVVNLDTGEQLEWTVTVDLHAPVKQGDAG